jgi:molecular chaperone GrpE
MNDTQDNVQDQEQFPQQDAPLEGDAHASQPGELDVLRKERDELKDKHLRALADLQNFRRRADLSVQQARELQVMDMARSLVTVMDHFDRALEVDPEKASVQSVLQGLRIVHDELLGVLQRFGIERVEAKPGDPFDPSRHEAMMREKKEGVEPDRVGVQFQPGYSLGDKTVRPAKVTVTE